MGISKKRSLQRQGIAICQNLIHQQNRYSYAPRITQAGWFLLCQAPVSSVSLTLSLDFYSSAYIFQLLERPVRRIQEYNKVFERPSLPTVLRKALPSSAYSPPDQLPFFQQVPNNTPFSARLIFMSIKPRFTNQPSSSATSLLSTESPRRGGSLAPSMKASTGKFLFPRRH